MSINWNTVLEMVVAGLILAAAGGVGALAFRDWEAFRRLFWRLIWTTWVLFFAAIIIHGVWQMAVTPSVRAEINQAAEQGTLPAPIAEALKREQEFRNSVRWIVLPCMAVWLYLAVLYLFGRPVLTVQQKKINAIQGNRKMIKTLERKLAEARAEQRDLEGTIELSTQDSS